MSVAYKLSALEPLDIAMVSLYFVLDQQNFVNFKDGINTMLLQLNLPCEGLRTSEEFEQRKQIWLAGVQFLQQSYAF